MNSLLYYYNNVQKMAAYQQAKRMQRGVLTAQGGFSTTDKALKQVPCTIRCVFVIRNFDTLQTPFTTTGGSISPRINIATNGRMSMSIGLGGITIDAELDKIYNIVFVVENNVQKVYLGGDLIASSDKYALNNLFEYYIGSFENNLDRFQGDYLLHQHFNYAMSADEVKALDNNGDPMGYVVPKAKRDSLLAEYLPQNLMYGRDDKTIATSWLDSAKQLPLSDEYMEPLFQSIGGYDIAANGAPEILYNE